MAEADDAGTDRRTKLERIIDRYEMPELETTLVERWTASGEERSSLRELARDVNVGLLEAALAEAGVDTLDGEVQNYYRLLADDDVSAGRRTEARSRIDRAGVDVDQLERDFVSHQAVHTFLTERAGVSYEGASREERIARTRDSLQRLRGRVETVADNNVERLAEAGDLDVGDVSVLLSVTAVCNDCGRQYDLDTLLEEGQCACAGDG
jgi:hypothetical protein